MIRTRSFQNSFSSLLIPASPDPDDRSKIQRRSIGLTNPVFTKQTHFYSVGRFQLHKTKPIFLYIYCNQSQFRPHESQISPSPSRYRLEPLEQRHEAPYSPALFRDTIFPRTRGPGRASPPLADPTAASAGHGAGLLCAGVRVRPAGRGDCDRARGFARGGVWDRLAAPAWRAGDRASFSSWEPFRALRAYGPRLKKKTAGQRFGSVVCSALPNPSAKPTKKDFAVGPWGERFPSPPRASGGTRRRRKNESNHCGIPCCRCMRGGAGFPS